MAKEQRAPHADSNDLLQIKVQKADAIPVDVKSGPATEGALVPGPDDIGTQVSSSSGSGKPPSLDGKSVASGTTFALDEKESLRPDDSASVKAGEDEDMFSPPGSGIPSSRMGSEDGTRAFRDQLREISRMGPSRQAEPRPVITRGSSQGVLYVPPQGSGVGVVPDFNSGDASQDLSAECPPDPRLLEALDSPKDRIMVLKLEQDFVDFVKDPKEASLTLPQLNGYHRMLAHRLADYYMLGHVVEDSTAVQIYKTANCRLAPPLTAIAPPSTAASTPPPTGPQMKILRRGDNVGPTIANGSNAQSKTGSENGESGNEKSKYPLTREEREAKYEAARKRIMGSAKPSETGDDPLEKDISRSSSTAPKKTKKKQRNDSDDDFEARSAYSAYYTTPFTSAGPIPTSYGFAHGASAHEGQFAQTSHGQQVNHTSKQQYGASAGAAWQNQATFHQQQQTSSPWMPNAPQPYDLSNDFQHAMSIQSPSLPSPQTHSHSAWQAQQSQQLGPSPQQWQGQSHNTPGYSHATHPYADQFRPSSSSSELQSQFQNQPYAYGQLPSQSYPGRPSSNLEHPLPGSYKGKHFNPQSQSFVPNYSTPQALAMPMQPFMSQVPQAGHPQYSAYGMPSPSQQSSNYPQQVPYQQQGPYQQQQQQAPYQQQFAGQQHQPQQMHVNSARLQQPTGPGLMHRGPGQPLTHPLPQPVFPPKPSPHVPLPPKPDITPPKSQGRDGPYGQDQQKESSIAKWGTPSSLPAKPPPAVEPFDPARFAHNQRQSSHGSSRIPSGSPGYGQVPATAGRM